MERDWRRDDLEKLDKPALQKILRNRNQSATGYREQLIKRILGEIPPKPTRISSTSNRSRQVSSTESEKSSLIPVPTVEPSNTGSSLTNLPYDVLLLPFYNLTYHQIIARCRTSQKFNKICNDERFWKEYAERHGIKKENPIDTWKDVVKNRKIEVIVLMLTGQKYIFKYPATTSIGKLIYLLSQEKSLPPIIQCKFIYKHQLLELYGLSTPIETLADNDKLRIHLVLRLEAAPLEIGTARVKYWKRVIDIVNKGHYTKEDDIEIQQALEDLNNLEDKYRNANKLSNS